jgi:hypothetical protein
MTNSRIPPRSAEFIPPNVDVVPPGTLKRIHVNQHVIRRNAKTGESAPPLSVKTSKGSLPCSHVVIHGDSVVRYSPDRPLSCGARVWIETRAGLTLGVGKDRPQDSRHKALSLRGDDHPASNGAEPRTS